MGVIYTKKDLLKELGISHQTLITWEKNGIVPKPQNTKTIAKLYSEDEFLEIVGKVAQLRANPTDDSPIKLKPKK